MMNPSLRDSVLAAAAELYHTEPEHPWAKYPEHVVLRHSSNRKWYALIMEVHRSKLGLTGDAFVDVLNVKVDSVMADSFRLKEGILPAYHMNKGHWITVLLDGTVSMNIIELLLDTSYELTDIKKPKK